MSDAECPPFDDAALPGAQSGDGVSAAHAAARPAGELQLQAWIACVIRADQAAFNALYDACAGRVYGLALRITRNPAQAEEVTEDTFWQVWREAPRYDAARGSAMAWILTIARSRALDSLRARDPAELTGDSAALLDGQSSTGDNPPDLLDAMEAGHALHGALAQLEAEPRQLIALAFFRGLSHGEIAVHTGLPLGTVKSHIRRGLLALKSLLGGATG